MGEHSTDLGPVGGADGDPELVLVAAIASNGVIGREGDIPWHHPEDLAHFERVTTGHPVILGRRTYESIVSRLGEPLPERVSVVLSSRELDLPKGAVRAGSIDGAIDAATATGEQPGIDVDTVVIAGGAAVYEQFLPLVDRLVLTEIAAPHEGDTTFPEWDEAEWREVARDDRGEFAFVEYVRD